MPPKRTPANKPKDSAEAVLTAAIANGAMRKTIAESLSVERGIKVLDASTVTAEQTKKAPPPKKSIAVAMAEYQKGKTNITSTSEAPNAKAVAATAKPHTAPKGKKSVASKRNREEDEATEDGATEASIVEKAPSKAPSSRGSSKKSVSLPLATTVKAFVKAEPIGEDDATMARDISSQPAEAVTGLNKYDDEDRKVADMTQYASVGLFPSTANEDDNATSAADAETKGTAQTALQKAQAAVKVAKEAETKAKEASKEEKRQLAEAAKNAKMAEKKSKSDTKEAEKAQKALEKQQKVAAEKKAKEEKKSANAKKKKTDYNDVLDSDDELLFDALGGSASASKPPKIKKTKCELCDLFNTEWEFCGKTGNRHIPLTEGDKNVTSAKLEKEE